MVCFSQCSVLFCHPKWMPSHFGWQHKIAGNYLTYILWCKWENLTTKRAINALPLKELFFSFNVGLFSFTALLRGKLHVTFRLIKDAANKKGVTSICNSYRGSVKKQKRKRKREMAEESTMNETHWNNKREISEESRARAQTTNSLTKTAASSQQQNPQLQRQKSLSEPTVKVADNENINVDAEPSGRQRSSSHTVTSSSYYFIQNHSASLTENAKKLSEEEINELVIDIFKPLDFYEILFDRMKNNDEQGNNSGQSDQI